MEKHISDLQCERRMSVCVGLKQKKKRDNLWFTVVDEMTTKMVSGNIAYVV